MALVAALPAELLCVADPAARGAAPSLRLTASAPDAAAAGEPFALFLELLTAAVATGEDLPAGGNDLPFAPREPALQDGLGDAALDAAMAALPLPLFDAVPLPAAPAASSLREIGEILAVSESRVCQIHGHAVLRVRARLDKWFQRD